MPPDWSERPAAAPGNLRSTEQQVHP